LKGESCSNPSIKQAELDKIIWDHLIELLKNPVLIEQEIDKRIAESTEVDISEIKKNQLLNELTRVTKSTDKLLDAYEESDCLTLKQLKERMKKLNQKKNNIKREMDAIEAHSIKKRKEVDMKKSLEFFVKSLDLSSEKMSVVDKQKVVRLLIDDIIIGDDITVNHCIPLASIADSKNHDRCPLQPVGLNWSSGDMDI